MNAARERSRSSLLEAATLVLSQNPGASLAEIAEQAGVGRATLHRIFPKREDLIREVALEAIHITDEAVAALELSDCSAAEALRRILEAIVPLGDRFHFLSSEPVAWHDPAVVAGCKRQAEESAELIEWMKSEGCVSREIPTSWAVSALDALIYAGWAAVHEGSIAQKDAAAWVYRTLMNGLGPGEKGEG